MSITRLNNPRRVSAESIVGAGGLYQWNPTRIAGCQLWLDASDPAVMFDATSGGSLVTDGNTVARWEDKSGNARHFTQSISNNRPTLRAATLNSLATLEFDGSNDNLTGDGTQYVKTNAAFTIYVVYNVSTTAGTYPVIFASVTNQTPWRLIESSDATYRTLSWGSSANFAACRLLDSTTRGNWYIASVNFGGSAATTVGSFDGAINTTFKGFPIAVSSSGLFGADTGSNASIGAQLNATNRFKGNIAELIIYDSKLSAADDATVITYLNRWAIY